MPSYVFANSEQQYGVSTAPIIFYAPSFPKFPSTIRVNHKLIYGSATQLENPLANNTSQLIKVATDKLLLKLHVLNIDSKKTIEQDKSLQTNQVYIPAVEGMKTVNYIVGANISDGILNRALHSVLSTAGKQLNWNKYEFVISTKQEDGDVQVVIKPTAVDIKTKVALSTKNLKNYFLKKLYYEEKLDFIKTEKYNFNPINSPYLNKAPYLLAVVGNLYGRSNLLSDEFAKVKQGFLNGKYRFGFYSVVAKSGQYEVVLRSVLTPSNLTSSIQTQCYVRGYLREKSDVEKVSMSALIQLCNEKYKSYIPRLNNYFQLIHENKLGQQQLEDYFNRFKDINIHMYIDGIHNYLNSMQDAPTI